MIYPDPDFRNGVMIKERIENILFLGNSITRHGLASYWWGVWGMAADSRDRDYVHLFVKSLKGQGIKVEFEVYNFFAWEGMAHDRAEALQLLTPKLSENLTLVVCQLGENIQSAEGLVEDYVEMFAFIGKQAPNAKILMISPFWPMPEVADAARLAAEKTGTTFVDITSLWGKQEFMCPKGYEVSGDDGNRHKVHHQGVLSHPGPKGHAEIAHRLMAAWEGTRIVDKTETARMSTLLHDSGSYEEIRPKLLEQGRVDRGASHRDIQHVIDGLWAYREQAVSEGEFDTHIFRQQMEKVFDESGYRQKLLNKKTEILIITDGGVGDFINLSASLREIRRIYEGAHITLLCSARVKALAEACPYVDELHLNSKNFNGGDFLAVYDWNIDFVTRLLCHRFDMAFVFGTYPSAYLLAYMSGAKERISYGKENHMCQGHPYAGIYPAMVELLTIQLPYMVQSTNAVDGYLGILDNFLHAPVKNRNIEVWCLPEDVAEFSKIIDRKFENNA